MFSAVFRLLGRLLGAACLLSAGLIPLAHAQNQGLPLLQQEPQGQQAPTVQRIAAVVNDEIITVHDLNERMGLVLAATGGVSSQEEYLDLREEVLRGMVDERLQIQEAAEFDLVISDEEVDDAIDNLARNNNMQRPDFENYLASLGSNVGSLVPQVRASLAWQELVRGRFGPQVRVSESEIYAVIDRMKNNAGEPEYQIAEIYLIVDARESVTQTEATARRLTQQIRNGGDFANLARQFSESTSAAVGGDLGWVQKSQLVPSVSNRIDELDIGEVSDPIRSAGGFYIVQLRDRRKILGVDPMDTQFTLRQISVPVSDQAAEDEVAALRRRVGEVTAGLADCADIPAAADELGTNAYGDLGTVSARDLPAEIRSSIIDLEVGQASAPILRGSQLQVLVVCGRDAPDVQPPTPDQVEDSLTNQRLAMMSRRYLRDIRRDAIVDYRIDF